VSRSMAALMSFEVIPGAVTVHAGQLVAIEQREGPGEVWVRDLVTGVRSKVLVAVLRGRETGAVAEMRAGEDLRRQTIDQDSWDRARERERVIKGLLEGQGDLEERIIAGSETLGGSRRQIYTWIARYRSARQTRSLLDKPSGRRLGTVRLDGVCDSLLRAAIDEHYLKQPRLKPEDIFKEVNRRCSAAGVPEIARGTVLARLRALDPETVARKRFGAKHAREKCRFAFKTRLFTLHDETFCLAVPFSRPQHRFNGSPVLANVFSGPTCHAVSEPMQTGWTTRSQQMPLPCAKPNLARVAAAVGLGQQHVRPPERRASKRRVIDGR
jgi:hypothetical protein